MEIKKISESSTGIFTLKEYLVEEGLDPVRLIRQLQAGPGEVQEVVTYVFGDRDPLGLDARSFTAEEFIEIIPRVGGYGPELAFDVIVRTEGHPVTVELTYGEDVASTNSLDSEAELEELLGPEAAAGLEAPAVAEALVEEPNREKSMLLLFAEETAVKEMAEETADEKTANEKTANEETANEVTANEEAASEETASEEAAIAEMAEKVRIAFQRRESAAERSWRAAVTALLLAGLDGFKKYDMDSVIRMCLLHDFWEEFPEAYLSAGFAAWMERAPAGTEKAAVSEVEASAGMEKASAGAEKAYAGKRKTPEEGLFEQIYRSWSRGIESESLP